MILKNLYENNPLLLKIVTKNNLLFTRMNEKSMMTISDETGTMASLNYLINFYRHFWEFTKVKA